MTTLFLRMIAGLTIFTTLSGFTSARAEIIDTYQNFKELAAHERGTTGCCKDLSSPQKNFDYSIEALAQHQSKITVFAIHAGTLEQGTGELAQAVAGNDLNLYVFEILDRKNSTRLHLTSEHFDEPQALALAAKSEIAVSLHGYADKSNEEMIGVGGGNATLIKKFMASTPVKGVKAVAFTDRLTGKSPLNIVNRCKQEGLQLEMSPALREHIKNDLVFRKRMAQWIRSVLTLNP
jgi:phage replication-related protein YjqB (UPF0714/DUF867 family)